ncbi:fructose-bisphosphate aldolase class II [Hydrogenispora ethanolica]|uniref:Fructose-bisphosphate aldolase class II n=1 Tax=Hydrogenispora ethanolica TaxID=1082276 RepID=A0A4R1R893_HYDET|nr:ketose-bisphosphate aldolase [Hydrogenispora ethanolica]TCL61875.1 fructose-bisphosphate aldolase class II [Hydrogenispora ethanolica]
MPLVPLRPLLEASLQHGFAHGAFNVNAVAQAQAVIEVHEQFRSAAILQGADLANAFMGGRADFLNGTLEDKRRGAQRIAAAVRKFGADSPVPVVLHLDHGKDFESVKVAIDNGYTSVMIDGSHLPFAENVELTRAVVQYAHPLGVTVEGELGVLAGVEDDVFAEHSTYTNPMTVCEFFKKTGVDCLAISYGTKHGAVKGEHVKLRKEIAIAAMENLRHEGIFGVLVSHGSSTVPQYIVAELNQLGGKVSGAHGIPIAELRAVIPYGVGKINVDTDIRLAVTRNIREYFANHPAQRASQSIGPVWELMEQKPEQFDPRVYLPPVMEPLITGAAITDPDLLDLVGCIKRGVHEVVGTLIVQFGSVGFASRVEQVSLEAMAKRYRNAARPR